MTERTRAKRTPGVSITIEITCRTVMEPHSQARAIKPKYNGGMGLVLEFFRGLIRVECTGRIEHVVLCSGR